MAKAKPAKAGANKHLHTRVSYLYQAASYLSTKHLEKSISQRDAVMETTTEELPAPTTTVEGGNLLCGNLGGAAIGSLTQQLPAFFSANGNAQTSSSTFHENLPLSRHLLSNLRSVSRKGQIRLSRDIKRSICKRCETLLIPGSTSTQIIANGSRNGKKPWADVLVVQCRACQTEKRFPISAKKNLKKNRGKEDLQTQDSGDDPDQGTKGEKPKPADATSHDSKTGGMEAQNYIGITPE